MNFEIITIKVPDGRLFYAIKLSDGTYLGQRIEANGDKVYPVYKTEGLAREALDAYLQPPKQ